IRPAPSPRPPLPLPDALPDLDAPRGRGRAASPRRKAARRATCRNAQRLLTASPLSSAAFDDPEHHMTVAATFEIHYLQYLGTDRSEEHTSELQSREKLVCRLL